MAIGVICLGAMLWRIAAYRYVADGYKRRILMVARNVVAGTAIGLVILFHFTSELAALVTILGFAAAGIAFAHSRTSFCRWPATSRSSRPTASASATA